MTALMALPDLIADGSPYYSDLSVATAAGLGNMFPVSIFAQIFHHSIPGLIMPFERKSSVPRVFMGVLWTTMAMYIALGISVGLYWGSKTEQTCTLNVRHIFFFFTFKVGRLCWWIFLHKIKSPLVGIIHFLFSCTFSSFGCYLCIST
jgi:tryptophan-rich sensory protein